MFNTPDEIGAVDVRTRGAKNGVCPLDATALLSLANIPAELTGKNAATATMAVDSGKVGGYLASEIVVGTQVDYTASKTLGTVYQNTTGKLVFVSVSAHSTTASSTLHAVSEANAAPTFIVAYQSVSLAGNVYNVSFFVPKNYYYKVYVDIGTPTLDKWVENVLGV